MDPATERRDALADYYGIDGRLRFDDIAQLLSITVPDVVSIIVPTEKNPSIVLSCIDAGIRVMSCEKPASIQLSEADQIVEACERTGTVLGIGSLIANHVLHQVGEWIAAGNIGRIHTVTIQDGLGAHVCGDGAQRLSPLRILTQKDVEWAEGWEREDAYSGRVDGASDVEADGPVYGRLGLSGDVQVDIPNPEASGGKMIIIDGDRGRASWSPQSVELHQEHQAELRNVTEQTIGSPAPQLRYTFLPLVESLIHAYESGTRPRPDARDMRFALEAAIGLNRSHHVRHARVPLPIADRSARLWPHPYRSFGGDVAGFRSLWPKYQTPSLQSHLQILYIK